MFLIFDTETSGLWRDDLPDDHPSQPHLLQLGAALYDAKWNRTGSLNALIRPDGWSIEPGAMEVHGITEARAIRHGIPVVAALAALAGFAANSRRTIGFNVEFDRKVISSAILRAGGDGLWWRRKAPTFFCTMEASTPIMQIPGKWGFSFPKLPAAYRFFYPHDAWESRHDAEDDMEHTRLLYVALAEAGAVPEVTFARGPNA